LLVDDTSSPRHYGNEVLGQVEDSVAESQPQASNVSIEGDPGETYILTSNT